MIPVFALVSRQICKIIGCRFNLCLPLEKVLGNYMFITAQKFIAPDCYVTIFALCPAFSFGPETSRGKQHPWCVRKECLMRFGTPWLLLREEFPL